MLSIQVLKTTGCKAYRYYFKQEDLPFDAAQEGLWQGKGAQLLGLSDKIEQADFEALYEGRLPNGQQLGKRTQAGISHRPGVDLTFSSPKSFSIVLALTHDERLIKARERAVAVALSSIEQDCAMARRMVNKNVIFEQTDNLVFATARHLTSRALDPQDHVHCLLLNITQCQDGVFRALASQAGAVDLNSKGVVEQIMARKKHYGLLFRVQLAAELCKLGIEIERHEHGFFEIKGISPELIAHFSKRRFEEILPYLENSPYQSAKAKHIATLATRSKKIMPSQSKLIARWWQETKELGCAKEIERVSDILNGKVMAATPKPISAQVDGALQFALTFLDEKQSVFSEHELINTALGHLPQGCDVKTLQRAKDKAIEKGTLVLLKNGKHYTTAHLFKAEQQLLKTLGAHNALKQTLLLPKVASDKVLARASSLSTHQREAIAAIGQSTYQWLAITGGAGVGKRHISLIVGKMARKQGYQVTLLVPSQQELKIVQKLTNLAVITFKHYQEQLNQPQAKHKKNLLIIQHAHLMGTHLLNQMMQKSPQTTRGLLLVNPHTTQGMHAGAPGQLLLSNGLPQVTLDEPYRSYQNAHQSALRSIEKKELGKALQALDSHIIAINKSQERTEQLVKDYCQALTDKTHPLVLAGFTQQMHDFNIAIRQQLKQQLKINQEGMSCSVLIPKPLSLIKSQSARYYKKGDWLSFDRSISALKVKPGTYAQVTMANARRNQLTIQTTHGKTLHYCPADLPDYATTVYAKESREFVIGDRVRVLKTSRLHPVATEHGYRIRKIKHQTLTLEHGRERVKLNLAKPSMSHLDYGYATNARTLPWHSELLCYLPSFMSGAHQRQLYRLIAYANHVKLYTDNHTKLLQCLEKATGDKLNIHTAELKVQKTPLRSTSQKAIDYATEHLIAREAGFHRDALFESAANFGFGHMDAAAYLKEVDNRLSDKTLLAGINHYRNFLTTSDMHSLEQTIVVTACQAAKVTPLSADGPISQFNQAQQLNAEQSQAFADILTSAHPIRALQGYPGTGKSTLMKAMSRYCQNHGIDMIALAPTISAANNLTDKSSGLTGQTLESFLVELAKDERKLSSKTLVVLDESSMVANVKLWALQKTVLSQKAHLLYVGDERQLSAIDAGKPFILLQLAGLPTNYLSDIKRQQTKWLKEAVMQVAKEQYAKAFETLSENIMVLPDKTKRLSELAKCYTSTLKNERKHLLIITPANEDRMAVNQLIREGLKSQGELMGDSYHTEHLIPKNLTVAQTCFYADYAKKDIVRFTRAMPSIGVKADDFATVIEVCETTQQVRLKLIHQDREIIIKPADFKAMIAKANSTRAILECYQCAPIELNVGDNIRFTRTDRAHHKIVGAHATIKRIDHEKHQAVIEFDNKQQQSLSLNTFRDKHFTYGYCSTTYSAQGASVKRVIFLSESHRTFLTHQRDFWVGLSRAMIDFKLITDDKQKLLDKVMHTLGDKLSAAQILQSAKQVVNVRAKQLEHLNAHLSPKPATRENPIAKAKEALLQKTLERER